MSVRRISLKPAAWPLRDQAAWAAACQPGDFLEPGGGAAGWREVSRKNIAKSYGVWIGFLAERGEFDPAATPAERVTRERVVAYVEHLMTINKLSSVAARIRDLSEALRVMAPKVDWTWLRRFLSNLRRIANDRSKLRRPPPSSRDLYDLGLRLMQRAESDPHLKRRRAALYGDGLMIAMLTAAPFVDPTSARSSSAGTSSGAAISIISISRRLG